MKTIGIKLADGSFFPIMEDNHPSAKSLELTTAHNNQTKVMVDLYRSKTGSMEDAEYVDSLQIDNLVSHPNGEPSISFSVSVDEDNKLSANIKDPETGKESQTAIPLISRSEEERQIPDEYDISDIADNEKENIVPKARKGSGLLSLADKMIENEKSNDDNSKSDFEPINDEDMFNTDDFLNFDSPADSDNTETQEDDISEPAADNQEEPDNLNQADAADDDAIDDFDLPDFDDTSLPDINNEEPEEAGEPEQLSDENFADNADLPDDTVADFGLPDFDDSTLPDINNEEPENIDEPEQLSDEDFADNTDLPDDTVADFDLPDFDDTSPP